jgi:glycine cleavage system transcriptional repressor
MNAPASSDFLISVLVPDRVGLLRDITQAIFAAEGNIGAIRQTLIDGFFSLTFTSVHPAGLACAAVRSALAEALEENAVITVLDRQRQGAPAPAARGPLYVVMTRGRDKPGTICAISSFMVENAINIEEWMVDEEEGEIIYIAQVALPDGVDFRALQEQFRGRMAAIGLSGLLCHENIFRATNEIGPIGELIG